MPKEQQTFTTRAIDLAERESYIKPFSDRFREVFSNPEYGQYVLGLDSKKSYSAQDIFETESHITVEQMDSISLDEVSSKTGEPCVWWHDPDKVEKLFRQKLLNADASLVLSLTDIENEIVGAACTYKTKLFDAFLTTEEWQNPFLYADFEPEESDLREQENFMSMVGKGIEERFRNLAPVVESTSVLVCNCMFTYPGYRGREHVFNIYHHLSHDFSEEALSGPLISELIRNHTMEKILRVCNYVPTGFSIDDDDHQVWVTAAAKYKEAFGGTFSDFQTKLKMALRMNRR